MQVRWDCFLWLLPRISNVNPCMFFVLWKLKEKPNLKTRTKFYFLCILVGIINLTMLVFWICVLKNGLSL